MEPSATVFDHAITQVDLAGTTYWLDATANYQRGPLAARSWPNYAYGLVLRPGTTALTTIAPSPVLPKTTVTQYIQLGPLDGETIMKVVTIAEGPDAEHFRAEYATTARNEIEQGNLNYYAKFYPEITETAPLVFTDDEQQNKIEVDEFYSIRKIWTRLPVETFYHCRIYPENIEASVVAPSISLRSMPLGVAYPLHQIFRAEVVVPVLSTILADDQTVRNPAFYYHRTVSTAGGKLFLECEYRALSDVVYPNAVPLYVRQLSAAAELWGYTVSSD
jgi:hypothetical protein